MILIAKNKVSKDMLLRDAFSKIKEEMTDHLDAINDNTNEINSNYDYMMKLEKMLAKMDERLDEMDMKIASLTGEKIVSADDFKDISLTTKEKEIFLLLYSRSGDLLDYRQISKSLGLTEASVRKNITSMTSKGIPVIKKYFDDKVYLILDPDFSNLQAKENILDIN